MANLTSFGNTWQWNRILLWRWWRVYTCIHGLQMCPTLAFLQCRVTSSIFLSFFLFFDVRLFGSGRTCLQCSERIIAGDMYVTLKENSVHVTCLVCHTCRRALKSGTRVLLRGRTVFCIKCYKRSMADCERAVNVLRCWHFVQIASVLSIATYFAGDILNCKLNSVRCRWHHLTISIIHWFINDTIPTLTYYVNYANWPVAAGNCHSKQNNKCSSVGWNNHRSCSYDRCISLPTGRHTHAHPAVITRHKYTKTSARWLLC